MKNSNDFDQTYVHNELSTQQLPGLKLQQIHGRDPWSYPINQHGQITNR